MVAMHLFIYLGLAFISDIWQHGNVFWASGILMGVLIWISISDIASFTIPDFASFLLVVSGLAVTIALQVQEVWLHVAAAVSWLAVFWFVGAAFKALRGYSGLGLGDAKLMAGAGAWLGLLAPISVVLFASVSGISFIITMTVIRRETSSRLAQSVVAFGPFLCVSIWSVWLFGPIG